MSSIAIEFDKVGKQYRLGRVGTGTLSHDLNRWWTMNILGKEDPYLRIGETNDRSKKGNSEYVWALKDISFKVEQGDVVGIIGKNGAGKSTLLKLLSRITSPSTGSIRYNGRIASLLEVGTGFHPEMTGRENIYMNGSIMGMTKAEITRKLDEIVDFAGVERYIDTPVKRYSSGMTVRLGFAVAAFLEPEILVVDEVLTVGDAEFQKKAIGKMKDVSQGGGRTVLFVSHNMAAVRSLCNHGVVLEKGMVAISGGIHECVDYYLMGQRTDNKSHTIVTPECRVGEQINKHRYDYVEARMMNDVDNMATEEPIKLHLKIRRNDSSCKTFQVGVFIANSSGLRVACCYSEPVVSPDGEDVFSVEVKIPHHNLSKGRYTVDLKLSDFNYINFATEYDQIKNVLAFEVKYVDAEHNVPFGNWIPQYGNVCMRDVVVNVVPNDSCRKGNLE